ncbi:MAG TPA: molybdopterin oxidoreductase family protein, partial [Rhodospirillales bacterium]|nr:molybdopterin oxidoreductase family protein [Rhodospirillales bacterium]
MPNDTTKAYSACPHDCPSTCALEIDVDSHGRVGRVQGAKDNTFTDGVICAKVARYGERLYHPDRLLTPLRRTGAKGQGEFREISWDDALDEVAEGLVQAEQKFGTETVWPYYYAGTMGLVMRDGIQRLRHVKKYSGQHSTICVALAWSGFIAGTGKLAGPDPREMNKSDVI